MKKIYFLLIISSIFFSCKKEDYSYKGPAYVDFPVKYQKITIRGNTNKDTIIPVYFRLVGPQQESVKNITFSIDDASSAVRGTHYSIDGTSAQLAPNSSYGTIAIKYLIPSFPEQSTAKIIIHLTGGDFGLNPNYQQIELEVFRQGFIDIFTGNYSCEEPDKPLSVKYNVIISKDSTKNRVLITNFWGFAKEGSMVYMDLKSNVDSVYIPSQNFMDKSNREYTISGNGRYNINDGSINISYSLVQKNSTYTEQGSQYYKRN